MTKYFLLSVLFTNLCFGQSYIQYEPEREFNSLIHKSTSSFGVPTVEFAKEHKIKSISFLRDTTISSIITFDENGNYINEIGFENNMVGNSKYKWDLKNRMTERRHYKPDGSFYYGYFYNYEEGVELEFDLEDSTLVNRELFLEKERMKIYSSYNETGKLISKSIVVQDNEMNYLMETRFQNDKIYVQYLWDYIGDSIFVTKVQYDQNGSKFSEKRHLEEIREGSIILHFTDEERLFRRDSINSKQKLCFFELIEKNGEVSRRVQYDYNDNGNVISRKEVDFDKNQLNVYSVTYDELNRPIRIVKNYNGVVEIFNYIFEYY